MQTVLSQLQRGSYTGSWFLLVADCGQITLFTGHPVLCMCVCVCVCCVCDYVCVQAHKLMVSVCPHCPCTRLSQTPVRVLG